MTIVKNLFYIFGKLKNFKPEGNWKIGKLTMHATGKIKIQAMTSSYTTVVTEVILHFVCFFTSIHYTILSYCDYGFGHNSKT